MKLPRAEQRKRSSRPGEAVILFAIGEVTFAISAAAVDEIRNTDGLRPVGRGAQISVPKVRFTLERAGETCYVVDGAFQFGILPTRMARVLVMRNRNLGLLVERIDRMAEIAAIYALPRAFRGEERRWYRGLALMSATAGLEVVPVVNAEAILSPAEAQLVASGLKAKEATA